MLTQTDLVSGQSSYFLENGWVDNQRLSFWHRLRGRHKASLRHRHRVQPSRIKLSAQNR